MDEKISEVRDMFCLKDPCILPKASTFLWNQVMMIQATCRGYATAQFMQPEPSKYSHAPNLEAKTFMQPEQPYYAHHPGRFVYIKDEENGRLYSAPYEPVREKPESYEFVPGLSGIIWKAEYDGILVEMVLGLPVAEPLELWTIRIRNHSERLRKISIYPSFTVGYMSWMNQSGRYESEIRAIICTSVTPYQKYQDYDVIKGLKDKTFFLSEKDSDACEMNQERFEGEGGIGNPDGIRKEILSCSDAIYEMPCAVFQHRVSLKPGEEYENRYIFGAAQTEDEIKDIRRRYFDNPSADGFAEALYEYKKYIERGKGSIRIQTPDKIFDEFVNHWLPRQVYYHGSTNRLTTDPQTRNFLQDGMGMVYIQSEVARTVYLTALAQQKASGEMPDGILLEENAVFKYINQIPHTDHCVWLPICLSAYLDESDDYGLLDEKLPYQDAGREETVFVHISKAMEWLIKNRDDRGLSYINQGDWCDPMNMVGCKGKGVSGWLTIAVSYALRVWSEICRNSNKEAEALYFWHRSEEINQEINRYLWDGAWYARGITDNGVIFGVHTDREGKIFLNPQSFSILCQAADEERTELILESVEQELETPYGVEMLAPPYTKMRTDVGRVTQKFPGSAENGSVYNHAVAFYIYALYKINESDCAYRLMRKMLPADEERDLIRRGQMPVFIPNYYRGAYHLYEEKAGVSSHLFNTGTISWFYRNLIDGLFGVKGTREGLEILPKLPAEWNEVQVTRRFRQANFHIRMIRDSKEEMPVVWLDGRRMAGNIIKNIQKNKTYEVVVHIK